MKRAGKKGISITRVLLISILSIAFVLFELFLYYLILKAYYNITWVFLLVRFIGFICSFYLYSKKSNSNYKLTWIIAFLIMPLSGTLIFLLFGNGRMLPKRKYKKISESLDLYIKKNDVIDNLKALDEIGYKHLALVNKLTGFQAYQNTETKFYGQIEEKHKQLIEDLKSAKKYIFIETFIISKGRLWDEIKDILYKKATEGVEIKLLFDDIGSKFRKPKNDFEILKSFAHVKIKAYNPMKENLTPGLNYRDHRKIIIIDGEIGYVGGDNLADEYVNINSPYGHWRDTSLRIKGESIYNLLLSFSQIWFMTTSEMIMVDKYIAETDVVNSSIHMFFCDGPVNGADPAYDLYLSLINNAQKSIYISTPYFIIDDNFIGAIERACLSGVDVRILVPHIPDKRAVFTMTRAHYRDILAAGGRIYEYTPGFNHAKEIIVDGKYAVIGTINCDYRSFYLHFECGHFMMYDPSVKEMSKDYISTLMKSQEITYEEWKKRPWYRKVVEFVFKVISPLL